MDCDKKIEFSVKEEEHAKAAEDYSTKAAQHRAFLFLTDEVTSKYFIGDLIGHGGGGAVYAGVRKSDATEVAIKFVIRDTFGGMVTIPGESKAVPVEVGLMQMVSKPFSSPYVLELLEWFEIPNYDVLILERPSPCMDLDDFIQLHGGKLREPLVRYIMRQLVQAVRHCHDCGVIHNDIKPGNILINTETLQIKLIDFGGGDLLKKTPYTYCPGTQEYFPPEWFQHRRYSGDSATVWTLGIVMFQLLHGDFPFKTDAEVVNGPLNFGPGLSKDCRKLLSWCLRKEPKSRPSFENILKWLAAGPTYSLKKRLFKKLTLFLNFKI